jgi:predicted negative regulator of RcsB-dependent stress response
MEYELNDQDRADLVKSFLQKYGYIIVGVILVVAVGLGVNSLMQNHRAHVQQNASIAYQALLTSRQHGASPASLKAAETELIQNYPHTVYASLTRLQLAADALAQNQLAEAEGQLTQALQDNRANALTPIVSLRLARVFLADAKPEAALELLKHPPTGFEASYALLRGDAELALNHRPEAEKAEETALAASANNPLIHQMAAARLNLLSSLS